MDKPAEFLFVLRFYKHMDMIDHQANPEYPDIILPSRRGDDGEKRQTIPN